MKNRVNVQFLMSLFLLTSSLSGCSEDDSPGGDKAGGAQESTPPFAEVTVGDFESEKTSPYFFRFGNKGNAKEGYDYLPRWNYTYEVADNPVANSDNRSARVLSYRSMEAQNYGIKILFSAPVPVEGLRNIDFKIYQPTNVVGKSTWKGDAPASRQKLCVKLLSSFNTINDFKQDEGLMLEEAIVDFTQEGKWVNCRFDFNPGEVSDWKLKPFSKGVVGLAIMPTYGAGVTLSETAVYQCYIDDIRLNVSGK